MSEISRRGFFIAAAGTGAAVSLGAVPAQAAPVGTVATEYQRQQTQHWCSAASTRIAMTAAGKRPTQRGLAADLGLGGPDGSGGLDNPYAIAKVINNRLDLSNKVFRYFLSQDMDAFDDRIGYGMSVSKPVIYNVTRVAGQPYSSGHYICITGRRKSGTNSIQYRISDPDSPARTGNWYDRAEVKSWNKFGRYTLYSYPT